MATEPKFDGALGVLTGGGDCPGLNAAIRAVVRKATGAYERHVVGFRDGWRGPLENLPIPLTLESTRGILMRGGTILGSSRTNPMKVEDPAARISSVLADDRVGALIAIGGEDTLCVAAKLADEGLPIIGIPKTINNDVAGTDLTIGFHTAVRVATEAIDRLATTAESHHRILVMEVMGRNSGWIALSSGMAGGAGAILIPEFPFDIDEVCETLHTHHQLGRYFSIVVVAEGAYPKEGSFQVIQDERLDEFGRARLGGIAVTLASEIEDRTGYETRAIVLGYVQRGGTPSAFDRVLATRFGVAAVDAAARGEFGCMVALRGTDVVQVPLSEAAHGPKLVDKTLYDVAQTLLE